MQVIMLGTGHGKAVNCYNYCFIMKFNNTNLLVDTGGGNQIIGQIKKINMKIEDIDNIFISHAHIDHILGLIWIIRFLCPKYYNYIINKKINIYGNNDVLTKLEVLIKIFIPKDFHNIICKKFNFIQLIDGCEFYIKNSKIIAFDIKSTNIDELGFLMEYNNKRILFTGDEKFNLLNQKFINNCDYVFMDARAIQNNLNSNHSTVEYSSKIAEEYNVKNLVLSHSIDDDLYKREKIFKQEVKKYYNGNVFIPKDFDVINID